MSNEIAEVLRRARAKIEQPEHWGKYWLAHAANRRRVSYDDPSAVQWCATGALEAAADAVDGATRWGAHRALFSCVPAKVSSVALFNDRKTTTHADIIDLYDCAIAKAEAESGE